jgi:prolyl oligopeptidase
MKRFLLVLAACGGGDKAVERPVVPDVTKPAPQTPPHVATRSAPPRAAVKVVKETHHGVVVEDPYRWLEGNDDAVKTWTAAQNAHSRKVLDGLPEIEALRAEVTAIVRAPNTVYGGVERAGSKLFASRKLPQKEQWDLIVFDDVTRAADAKLVLDPTAGGKARRTIDWFEPSPDGTKIAVSLSENGSEEGDLHIIDLDGKDIEPVIPNVQRATGGGSVAWTPDGKAFYYTRYPAAGEKPEPEREFWMQVYFHALGTPIANDRYEIGKDFPKIAEVIVSTDAKGRVLAKVQNGDGGEFRHYLRDTKGAWRQFGDWKDGIVYVGFGTTDDLWMISRNNAPRGALLRLPANAKSIADGKVVVPEGKDAIVTDFYGQDWGVVDAGDRLYLTYQIGGPMELRAFTRTGKPAKAPVLPPVSSSSKPEILKDGHALVVATSYTTPRAFYRFDPKTNKTTLIEALSPKPPVDLSGLEAIREHAISKDGTKVPFTILWPKGAKRDGSVPCLAMGYGGYGVSETPAYLTGFAPLLTRGMCIVQTNLRGGSEFGEAWHKAGKLTNKQNVFDDFAAVLTFLVDNKVTSSSKLAILGGSNGGLLMGAMITQHPTLVKAVVSLVGIYDMLRAETSSNGAYNVTEFGSVKDKAQFEALYAYSPYHKVANTRTRYPAILMTAGENDTRVPAWHSRKFTAALQAAQTGDAPILLRTSATAGHGAGTAVTEYINDLTQMTAFILWQLRS